MFTTDINKGELNQIKSVEELDDIFELSKRQPVVLFKHSRTCPISKSAYQEMKALGETVWMVVVQNVPTVSQEIESRTGVRHESPQVIVVKDGVSVWNASHWNIRTDDVRRAVDSGVV